MPAQRTESVHSKEQTMIRMVALLLLPLAVSACGARHQALGKVSGNYRALNPGHWTPTRDDLRGPRAPLPPAQSPTLAHPATQGTGA